ncbi:hypothetical protein [Pelagicoccus sp. SDUM812003]|uniref:hypothetical protein n=1 Tax=Pelagicoccus sp. SDUM812003 TaxID=3041267 RepID=UPI00280C891C|nr:hypothetical protein [Pelagicoccus sp. SDUM812003]MDQ8201499.1 hypothetical protein [Pelagicoccus sp. SDUM812003]
MRAEPNLEEANKLGFTKQHLLGFYVELPKSKTQVSSPSDLSGETKLALGIAEQLKLLADGVYRELPRNLQLALQNGVRKSKPELLMIASILAALQSDGDQT